LNFAHSYLFSLLVRLLSVFHIGVLVLLEAHVLGRLFRSSDLRSKAPSSGTTPAGRLVRYSSVRFGLELALVVLLVLAGTTRMSHIRLSGLDLDMGASVVDHRGHASRRMRWVGHGGFSAQLVADHTFGRYVCGVRRCIYVWVHVGLGSKFLLDIGFPFELRGLFRGLYPHADTYSTLTQIDSCTCWRHAAAISPHE
jgi:hypothetical protein